MEDEPLMEKKSIQNVHKSPNTSGKSAQINHVDVVANHEIKKDFTAHLALSIAACTLGSSFQFGYNTGVVNAPEKVLKNFIRDISADHNVELSENTMTFLWAVTVSIFCLGGMMGGVSAGYWANKFGRKKTLMLNNILMIIAVAIEISSKWLHSYIPLIIGRLVVGINAGINTGTAPMYLSEIAPLSLRGLCGTFNQLCITFGVLMSEIIGNEKVLGTTENWQYCFGFPLIMVVWQLCALSFCPESPRFLMISRNSEEEAHNALVWLRGADDVGDEIDEMIAERDAAKNRRKFTVRDLLSSQDLRVPLIISVVMHLSQQLSGINAVIYYSTNIFKSAGLSESNAQAATLATGAVNVSMTFVSALIMDRVGRRTLHLSGLGGMFISSYILTIGLIGHEEIPWLKFICVVAVVCYIIAFATGPGAIPWFFVAELFNQDSRSAAVSISVLVNWSANFTVGVGYPFLQKEIDAYSFIPFVAMLAIFWLFTLYKVPETKGRTIEDISASFRVTTPGYSPLQTQEHSD